MTINPNSRRHHEMSLNNRGEIFSEWCAVMIRPANDNMEDKIVQLNRKYMENVLSDPITLLANDLYEDMFELLTVEGFDMEEDRAHGDLCIIHELIKAMLYRTQGIDHPFQDFLDQFGFEE